MIDMGIKDRFLVVLIIWAIMACWILLTIGGVLECVGGAGFLG